MKIITPALLKSWPLPQPDEGGDKDGRGRVLIVGGSAMMPGAVLLAATAALRAGAGKLQIATAKSVAQALAVAIPEAYVLALPEKNGAIDPNGAKLIAEFAEAAHSVLIGPGMVEEPLVVELIRALVPHLGDATLVLDAAALAAPSEDSAILRPLNGNAVLTPHAIEMSLMRHLEQDTVSSDPIGTVQRAAQELGATVTLKGSTTYIAAPDGALFCNKTGNVGLATSGSGDTLAGIVAGLAARGASPIQAAAWGVHLHATAGERLAKRIGPLGFLARELLAEVPALMFSLGRGGKGG